MFMCVRVRRICLVVFLIVWCFFLNKMDAMHDEPSKWEPKTKRARAPNYTSAEKEALVNLVSEYSEILENKKTDSATNFEKRDAWKKITERFSSMSPNMTPRTMDSLRKYYEHLKENVRKRSAEKKQEMYKTGGGSVKDICTEDTDDLLLSIINKKSVFGINSPFDSDKINPLAHTKKIDHDTNGDDTRFLTKENSKENYMEISFLDDSVENLCEIPLEPEQDTLNQSISNENKSEAKKNWAKSKPTDLRRPKNKLVQENISRVYSSRNLARRRPIVQTLTSSRLGEKYESLIDKKLELLECHKQEHKERMETLKLDREAHKLRIESLQLEVMLKRKQLGIEPDK